MPDRASGFCVYNDVAVGIQWLLDQGVERVAYVDVDVHHGDGVEAIFWDDPRVLTVSLHETGQFLFPGTGFADDIGGAGAEGTRGQRRPAARHRGRRLAAAFHAVVPDAAARVRPRGAGHPARLRLPRRRPAGPPDAHRRRPARGVPRPARPAHEVAGGRWVATGGGGYALVDVVPRAWSPPAGRRRRRPARPGHAHAGGVARAYVRERLGVTRRCG